MVTIILGIILGVALILTPSIRESIFSNNTKTKNKSDKTTKTNKTIHLIIIILIYLILVILLACGMKYLFTFTASMELASANSYCQKTNPNDMNGCINRRLQTDEIETEIALHT